MKNTVVGKTVAGVIMPHSPVTVQNLNVGDIVYVCSDKAGIAPQWYRVYDGGDKGLRFFCVTERYAEAVEDAEQLAEYVEAEDAYPESFADAVRRGADDEYTPRELVEQEPERDGWL